jgi:PilZ domain-containing protein
MLFRTNYSAERRWPRQWWNSSVEVFTTSAHVKALGINISLGGMGLFAVANLHVGSPVEIEFESPISGKRHRLSGIVRHRALYLYGVEFLTKTQFAQTRSSAELKV